MGVILESDIIEVVYLSIFVFWMVFVYFVKCYDYWPKRGVPHVPPIFPLGSLPQLLFGHVPQAIVFDRAYKQFSHHRFFGFIEVRTPCIVINDPNLIREILSKKFNSFTDRFGVEMYSKGYLNHNLSTMMGDEWREMRIKLTPAYTACKMKIMFFLVKECSDQLLKAVEDKIRISNVFDINDFTTRFTMDVIGTCAFGLDINALTDENSHFYKMTKSIWVIDYSFLFKLFLTQAFPILHKMCLITMTRPEIRDFITNLIRSNVAYREANKVKRFDFLDLLIKIRQNESILDEEDGEGDDASAKHSKSEGMTIEQMAAETYVFFTAGFETSSSVLSFCLYELSCNHNIQDKVYKEVEEVLSRYDGVISFQALQEMTYLDQVVNETMRHYPALPYINRVCTQTYKIPDSDITIDEGIRLLIPVYSLHHDPRYYTDPHKFDPDRFSPENCEARHQYVFLPFGEGPRMCIGLRFGLMLVKAAVVTLVNNYALSLAPETPVPVQLDSRSWVLHSSHPLKLVFTHRRHTPPCNY